MRLYTGDTASFGWIDVQVLGDGAEAPEFVRRVGRHKWHLRLIDDSDGPPASWCVRRDDRKRWTAVAAKGRPMHWVFEAAALAVR